MKIKITNTAFVEANAAMKPLVGKDSTGLFSNVRLDSTGHAVSLTGTNGDIQLEWRIKEEAIESADAGVATVSGARLAAFASAMPCGIVTVEDVAEDKIKVEGAGVTFRLATGDAAGYPAMIGPKPEDGVIDAQETEKADSETEKADSETEKPETGTEKPETGTEKRDWVGEAVQCFIKDAQDLDPTDPISAIAHYFAKNATPDLKARCEKEGKNATGCWRFIEAVAKKALGNRPGHIDPSAIYAIAMHYFEDVPKDWDKKDKPKKAAAPKKTASVQQQAAKPKKKPKKPAETPSEIRKEKERMAKAKAKAKKPRVQQGFFFEMLDMHTGQPEKDGLSSPQASAGASGEENAMVPRTLPASTSSTESEVQV